MYVNNKVWFCRLVLEENLMEHSNLKSQKPQKLGGGQKIFTFKEDCKNTRICTLKMKFGFADWF